ncbi:MAG: zinc ribbon domain-containing protein, partial [Thermomicrobiales bacterium]|nr:zinc ribbon domain-containing protein [Thermomicrobiales bacterium]
SRWGASLGGLLGAANGALLIAMALRLYYLAYEGRLTSDPLDDSIVTRVLWQNFDWFVLGFLVLATLLLLYSRFNRLSLTVPDPPARSNLPRPVPPPVPRVRRVEESEPLSATPVSSSRNGVQRQISEAPVDETIYAPQSARAVNPEAPTGRSTTAHAEESRAELPSARNAVRFCPNCGMTLDASDRFCPDCGYTL